MGTKIATLRTAFIKYLVMLIGGLALSVITPFLVFTIFASLGIVNYANQSEEFVKTIAPVLASTPDLADVTENMPPGCDYLLLDKSYTILETSLKNDDVKSALRYATDGVNTANNGKQFLLITRDKELIVLQYYIGSRFINPWLNKYFPSPEMILYSLIALNCVFVCILLTIRFSRRLQKQLVPIMNATEEISSQNLDFEIGHSNIKEFEDVLLSFSKMRDNLKNSLEQQWAAEQTRKEQIAALAHDLKTPLTVIRGNIDLLEETPLNSEQQEFIKYASFSSEQMESYIKTLIELSRASMGYGLLIQQIPFSSFWENLCEQIRALCSIQHINLQTSTDTPPEHFQGDRILIERAVMNIVSNAFEFSPEQSILKVKAEGDGKTLKIRITDSGTGFSQKALKHAKELFFMDDQSRSSKLHFGMGLYITNHIVEQHHGNMQIQNSAETKGGEVILTFPLNQEQLAAPL
ncbi:MAG: ATP-binding protein [Lachnospiraceae bacterium]